MAVVQPWYAPSTAIDGRAAGEGAGEAQREVVRLAAGVDEEHGAERRRDERREPIREPRQALVEEARVRVEQPERAGGGRGHARMAVAEHGHVVDHVEVGAAVGVVEVLAPAADQLRRARRRTPAGRARRRAGAARAGPRGRAAARRRRRRAGGRGPGTARARRPARPAARVRGAGRAARARAARARAAAGLRRGADRAERRTRRDRLARSHARARSRPGGARSAARPRARGAAAAPPPRAARPRPRTARCTVAPSPANTSTPRWTVAGSLRVRRRVRADPRLAPAPDGHVARRHRRGGGEPRRRAPAALGERLASRPEVDRHRPATAGLDERRRREEAAQLRGAGVRLEPAGGAGHRLRQLGRDGEQGGEPGPGDLGRVDDVAVVRLEDALERAADGAGGGPSEHEREQRGQLGVGQRERVVEAPGQVPDRDRRVVARARDRGDRDRELADAVGAERVAEVDQRRMAPAGPRGRAGRGCCTA